MNTKQLAAFELYFSMDAIQRSFDKVSTAVGVSKRTVWEWSRKFDWSRLIEKRTRDLQSKMQAQTESRLMDMRTTAINFWTGQLNKLICVRKDGSIGYSVKPKDIADAERITKNLLILLGDSREREQFVDSIIEKVLRVLEDVVPDVELRAKILGRIAGIATREEGVPPRQRSDQMG